MSITLSVPAQAALDSILRNGRDVQVTQNRLATGLKVATAADGPAAFFTARGLNNRANDFSSRFDNIQQGLKTVELATKALDGVEKLVEQMKGLADQARGTTDSDVRTQLARDFNDLRNQLTTLVSDATYNGVNLLQATGSDTAFEVRFSEAESSTYNVSKVTASLAAFGLADGDSVALSAEWGGGNATALSAINSALEVVGNALSTIRQYQTSFATATGVLTTRANFTEDMMSTLRAGANQLTVANLDEEGARLASLNTRGQLAQTTLALAVQREQSILRLL